MTLPVIDIRDAQMFQRAPRRKFERLDPFEYYDDDEFVDRKKKCGAISSHLPLWDDHNTCATIWQKVA